MFQMASVVWPLDDEPVDPADPVSFGDRGAGKRMANSASVDPGDEDGLRGLGGGLENPDAPARDRVHATRGANGERASTPATRRDWGSGDPWRGETNKRRDQHEA